MAVDPMRAGRLLGLLLLLATLANGAPFLLKKVGVLEGERYDHYWQLHCGGGGFDPNPLVRRCDYSTATSPPLIDYREAAEYLGYLYEANGWERWLKLLKDLLLVGLLAGSMLLYLGGRLGWPRPIDGAPAWLLLALLLLGCGLTLSHYGPGLTLAGVRSFGYLLFAVAAAGWGSVPLLRGVAGPLVALLLLQLALVIPELAWGVHLHGHAGILGDMPKRMSGALVQPNSLGIFAVLSFAFIQAFAPGRSFVWVLLVTLLVVLASGSATGTVLLGVYLLLQLAGREGGRRGWVGRMVALGLVAGLLFLIDYSRVELFHSPLARIDTLQGMVSRMGLGEMWFGLAVGAGTNAAFAVPLDHLADPDRVRFISDSTLTSLVAQLGLTGAATFYGLLLWAAWRLPQAAHLLFLLALSSLMLNVTELFPINLLLGLVLAAAMADGARRNRSRSPAPAGGT